MRLSDHSPLPKWTRLFPDESLTSLLVRLATLNCYDPFAIMEWLCLGSGSDDLYLPVKGTTYERISALSGINPIQLHNASPHGFVHTLAPQDPNIRFLELRNQKFPLMPKAIATQHLRPERKAQFCPDCLKESTHHRRAWIPSSVSACLAHKCLLIDQCPCCGRNIGVRDIVTTRCYYCGYRLASASTVQLEEDELGMYAQRMIYSWFRVSLEAEFTDKGSPCPYPLPGYPGAVLYGMIDRLCRGLRVVSPDEPHIHKLPGGQILLRHSGWTTRRNYTLYATAFKALLDWPKEYYRFLAAFGWERVFGNERCTQCKPQTPKAAGRSTSRSDGNKLSHITPQSAKYRHNIPSAGKSFPLSAQEAADLLHTTVYTVLELVRARVLPEHSRSSYTVYVEQEELLKFERDWAGLVSVSEAAHQMGLQDAEDVFGLVQIGLLEARLCREQDGAGYMVQKQAIYECSLSLHFGYAARRAQSCPAVIPDRNWSSSQTRRLR